MKRFLPAMIGLGVVVAGATTTVAPAVAAPTTETSEFTVVLADHAVSAAALDVLRDAGGQVTRQLDEIGVVQVQADDATAFLAATVGKPGIASVGPSLPVKAPGPVAGPAEATAADARPSSDPADYMWNIDRVTGSGAAWNTERGSKSVVVGVIDTGIDFDHPDLVDNIVPGSKTFVPGTIDARDAHFHGTHVAGTIAANGAISGVAPEVGLRAYRVFNTGGAQQQWITEAIVAAANDGVDVINMSLGGMRVLGQWFYTDPVTGTRVNLGNEAADWVAYERAVRYAVSRNATVVASAGNDALNLADKHGVTRWYNDFLHELGYTSFSVVGATFKAPAALPGVVTVSATGGGFGSHDRLAFYSNYGPGSIDVAAPGGDLGPDYPTVRVPDAYKYLVLSTIPTYLPCRTLEQDLFDCRHGWAAGTSMASPHVAGVAALVISQELTRTGAKPTPATVVRTLQRSAEDIGKVGYDSLYGHGMVDAVTAVAAR